MELRRQRCRQDPPSPVLARPFSVSVSHNSLVFCCLRAGTMDPIQHQGMRGHNIRALALQDARSVRSRGIVVAAAVPAVRETTR
jgi:hypothetical protein